MTRPSHNTDERLLAAGRTLMMERGVSRVSLREVAKKAGVNLGMFHYHFKSKRAFSKRLLEDVYEEFFKEFRVEAETDAPYPERLRRSLFTLGKFVRDNRILVLSLIKDVLNEEKASVNFLGENLFRHATYLAAILKEGQVKGFFRKMPLPRAMSFLGSSVVIPSLMVTVMERAGAKRPLGMPISQVLSQVLSDEALNERAEMAVRGISL
jgi:AcrR family transcriptional regulator